MTCIVLVLFFGVFWVSLVVAEGTTQLIFSSIALAGILFFGFFGIYRDRGF